VTLAARLDGCDPHSDGVAVLDIVYVAAAIALFALIALVARGVEKL
jgi:hypothetical protein